MQVTNTATTNQPSHDVNQQNMWQQPHQQTPQYNAPAQVQQATVVFDQETQEILNSVYPEMKNALVNLAIKRFSKEPEFVEYFLMKELRGNVEVQETVAQVSQPTQSSQPTQQQSTSPVISLGDGW